MLHLFDLCVEALDAYLKVRKMLSSLIVCPSLQVGYIFEFILKKGINQAEMFARGGNILPGTSGSRSSG